MRRSVALGLALMLAAPVPGLADEREQDKPRIDPLDVRRESGRLAVAYRVQNGLSEQALERIQVGLPTTFRHSVEILSRRAVPLFPSKVLASGVVEATVTFDSLTRQYDLQRTITIRRRDGERVVREENRSVATEEEMGAFMTECPELVLLEGDPSQQLSRARVRAESWLERRYLLLVIPSSVRVSAERRLPP